MSPSDIFTARTASQPVYIVWVLIGYISVSLFGYTGTLYGYSGASFCGRLGRRGVRWQEAKEGSVRTAGIPSIHRAGNTIQGQG